MSRAINQAGIDLIKSFERCELTAYQDVAGIWTIGWGHTAGVTEGMVFTQAQADNALLADLRDAEAAVENGVGAAATTDDQFGAMVSLCYNIGVGAFADSTVLRQHCAGAYLDADDRWRSAGSRRPHQTAQRRTDALPDLNVRLGLHPQNVRFGRHPRNVRSGRYPQEVCLAHLGIFVAFALALAAGAANAEPSCSQTAGPQKAHQMVQQCLQVSPATHPPCNAANACALIEDEIHRGCALLGKDAPAFCVPSHRPN
jgi:GH24 family phage-related lysozyme (muramidase)